MPKRKQKSLSTPELLIRANERLNQSRHDLSHLRRMMDHFDTRYSDRPWSIPESVLDHAAIIAQREYISQLPLGNLPHDITDWLTQAEESSAPLTEKTSLDRVNKAR